MRLFVYCAGGFGLEILDVARRTNARTNRWSEIGLVDDAPAFVDKDVCGCKPLTFGQLCSQRDRVSIEIVIAHGEPVVRKLLMQKLDAAGFKLGTVVDETSIISGYASLADGVVITPYCSVAVCAKLGRNVALNTKAIVGHDIQVGDNTVISSMVNVGGACIIGSESYIGMGVQIKEGLKIGNEVIVGMGSVVHHDIPDGVIAMGNPARPIRRNENKTVFSQHNGGNRV